MPPGQPGNGRDPGSDMPPPDGEEASAYVPGQLLVRFKSGTAQSLTLAAHDQHQARMVRSYRVPSNLHLVELPEGMSVDAAVAEYREDPNVLYVQPNFRYRIKERFPDEWMFWEYQWSLHNVKYWTGRPDADIDAPEAWALTTGSHDVILGVIDTGIDYTHEDLFENVFSNPGEIPGNGLDDDGNGFVDDIHGIDAVEHNGDPYDIHGHGTFVSGIIAARGNNDVGITGVMWDAQIVSCKAFGINGLTSDGAILTCMDYFLSLKTRTENPVDIVATNNSWGTEVSTTPWESTGRLSQALLDAVEAHHRAGILFVAAAGNNGSNNDIEPVYPASYEVDNVISVAATDSYDILLQGGYFSNPDNGSNFGPRSVDVGAPGSDVLSTALWEGYSSDYDDDYNGATSFAAAHVTGVIGLLKAYNPSLEPAAIKNLVLAGGDETFGGTEWEPYGTHGTTLSGRRINAFGSLTCEDRVVVARLTPTADEVDIAIDESLTLGVLSIDCAQPHPGPHFVTVRESGDVIQLVDESGNGHFRGSFQSLEPGLFELEFSTGDVVYVNVGLNYDRARDVDFEYRDIQGTEIPADSYSSIWLPAPFPIHFGDAQPGYDGIYVSGAGALSFDYWIGAPDLYYYDGALPSYFYQTVVAPFWTDFYPYPGGVTSAVLGAAPNRELVIDWNDMVSHWWGGNEVRFQVVFFENSRNVLFSYADVDIDTPYFDDGRFNNGAIASVGLQVSERFGRQFSLYQPSLRNEMTLLWSMGTPIAAAGPDQVVAPGDEVMLDGSTSREVVGAISSYVWVQTTGTPVLVEGESVAHFVAPQESGTLTFELSVIDEDGDTSTDTVNVIVNAPPVADAGNDFQLANHLGGTLDGSASLDVDGAIIGYAWRQISGEPVALAGAGTALATFTAPAQPQRLVFELTIRDEYGSEGRDTVDVDIFHNDPPVAAAGNDRLIRPGSVVTLDGLGSHDPDGSIVRYAWENTLCLTGEGSCVIDLVDAGTAQPVFEAPAATGMMIFRLTITDDAGATSSDTVVVVASFQEPSATIAPQASCATTGTTLALDGSASMDDDGQIVSYHWAQRAGTPVAFGNPDAPVIAFAVPSSPGPLVFALTVTDDDGLSNTAEIELPVHAPPAAVAVASASFARRGETVTLDGSQSQDAASYAWVQTDGPPAVLSDASAAVASFVAPGATGPNQVVTFALTVGNVCGATATDTASVSLKGR